LFVVGKWQTTNNKQQITKV